MTEANALPFKTISLLHRKERSPTASEARRAIASNGTKEEGEGSVPKACAEVQDEARDEEVEDEEN